MKTQEMTDELRARLALAIVRPLYIDGGSYLFRVDCPNPSCDGRPEVFDVAVKFDDLTEAERLSRLEIASRGILVDEGNNPTHFALDWRTLVVVDEVVKVYEGLTQEDFSFLQM